MYGAWRASRHQRRRQVYVLPHGIVGGGASDIVPGVVFGLAHEIQRTRTLVGGVAHRRLFIERVKKEQRDIVRALSEAVDVLLGLFESRSKIGHIPPPPCRFRDGYFSVYCIRNAIALLMNEIGDGALAKVDEPQKRLVCPTVADWRGMRVVIDATPLLVRSAGVKNYLYHWILHRRRDGGHVPTDGAVSPADARGFGGGSAAHVKRAGRSRPLQPHRGAPAGFPDARGQRFPRQRVGAAPPKTGAIDRHGTRSH